MGNTQSNDGSFEPGQLESVKQSLSQRNLDHDNHVVTSSTRKDYERSEARPQIQSHLPDSAEELALRSASQSSSNDSKMRAEAQHVPSGNNSSNTQPDFEAAMAIINHLKQTASPDQLAVLQHAILTYNNGPSPNSSTTTITPPPKDPSPKNSRMMRRRSLFSTPALVSRSKKKKSSPDLTSHQTWSPEMFTSSPLSKIAGWQSQNNGVAEIARSETPDAMTTYLGTHQLGSLRITNGIASPEPSIYEMRPQTMESGASSRHEAYYTASEGSGRDSPAKSELVSSRRTSAERLELQPVPEVFVEEVDDADDTLVQGMYHHYSASNDRPVSALNMYTVEASSNPFLATAEQAEREVEEPEVEEPEHMSMYTMEASSNPFLPTAEMEQQELERPRNTGINAVEAFSNTRLSTTERDVREPEDAVHNEQLRDETPLEAAAAPGTVLASEHPQNVYNDEESIYSEHLPEPESSQSREVDRLTALRSLGGGSYSKPGILSASSSVYSSVNPRKPVGSRRLDNAWQKQDSGYTSLISISDDQEDVTNSIPIGCVPSDELDPPAQHQALLRQNSFTLTQHEETHGAQYTAPDVSQNITPTVSIPSTPHKSRTTSLEIQRPLLEPSPKSLSATSSPQTKQPQKKLQKRRPFSERYNSAPLIVQTAVAERSFNDGLPRIPSLISSRHSDRMVKHPDMEHLERTFKSVSHSNSRDSLNSTNFSAVSIHFPSPTRTPDIPDQTDQHSRGRDAKKPPKPRSSSGRFFRSRSRKSKERRPLDGSDDEDGVPTGVTDFGTVAESLGSSPYDMAAAAGKTRNRNGELRDATAPMHPHQLGSMPRRKIGMSDEQASEFALARSRDRLENMGPRDQERIARHREVNDRRRQSFGGTMRERPYSLDGSGEKRLSSVSTREQSRDRESMEVIVSPVQDPQQSNDAPHAGFRRNYAEPEDQAHYRYEDELRETTFENHEEPSNHQDDYQQNVHEQDVYQQDIYHQNVYQQDVCGSPEHEQSFSWEQSAKAWRIRRQNMDDDLQHAHQDFDHQYTEPQVPPRMQTPLRRSSEEMYPMHFDDEEQPSLPVLPPRVKPAAPSVLERAAAYERSISPERQQVADHATVSPPKRSPSPPKRAAPKPPIESASPSPPTRSAPPLPTRSYLSEESQYERSEDNNPAPDYAQPEHAKHGYEHDLNIDHPQQSHDLERSGSDSRVMHNAIRNTYLCYEGLRPQSRGYPEPEVAQYQVMEPEQADAGAEAEAEASRPLTRGQKLGLAMRTRGLV